jgi:hypothetical protein
MILRQGQTNLISKRIINNQIILPLIKYRKYMVFKINEKNARVPVLLIEPTNN